MDIETKKRRHPNNTCNCKCHTCNCCTRNTEDELKRNCKEIPISNFQLTVNFIKYQKQTNIDVFKKVNQDEGSNQKGQDFQQQESFSLNPTKKEVEKIQEGSQSINFLRRLKEKMLEKCNSQNKDDSFEEIIQANIQRKDEIKVQLSENDMMDQIQEISEEDIIQKIKGNAETDFLNIFEKLRISLRNITYLQEDTNPITSKIEEKMEIILKNITNFIWAASLESKKESGTEAKKIFKFDLFNFEADNFGYMYRNQMMWLFKKQCFSNKDLVQKFLIADFKVNLILQDTKATLKWLRQVFNNNDEMKKQITSIGEEVLKLGFKIDS